VVGDDLRMRETIGPRGIKVSFINWYTSKLHRAAHRDPVAAEAFLRVANLLAPPPSILYPKIAMRVLKGNLFPANPDGIEERPGNPQRWAGSHHQ
jgi:hypothetical protein